MGKDMLRALAATAPRRWWTRGGTPWACSCSIPRPVPSPVMHMPQCAPVNVPGARMRRPTVEAFASEADEDDYDVEMMSPQEMVARSPAWEPPMTTFWVLEPGGRWTHAQGEGPPPGTQCRVVEDRPARLIHCVCIW